LIIVPVSHDVLVGEEQRLVDRAQVVCWHELKSRFYELCLARVR
jgi:hypothetical protein